MAPQAVVVGHEDVAPLNGATFLIAPVTIGANQIPLPIGDPVPVTSGPFRCAEDSLMGPEITIADSDKCTDWEPTLELQVGLIDNSLDEHMGTAFVAASGDDDQVTEVTVFDGLDLGWHYTSSLDVTVTHDLSVTSAEVKGVKKKSSETSLAMSSIGEITLGRDTDPNNQTYYALSVEPDETIRDVEGDNVGSCQPAEHATLWDYNDNLVSRVPKPDDCFRLTVDHGLDRNYLDAYSVTMDPVGADVSWGPIPWWMEMDDLTCPSMSWEAMEQVDVCGMFEEEVDRLPTPEAIPMTITTTQRDAQSNVTGITLAGFNLHFEDAGDNRHQFTAMWYARKKADGKAEMPPPNLYAMVEDDGTTGDLDESHMADHVSGYNATAWVPTIDDDFDPMYGDLGKVDIGGDDESDNFAEGDDSRECTADDGGSAKGKDDNNGTLCDAEDVEIETTVTFPLGLGYGCDAVEKTYTLTCQWNTRGNRSNAVDATLEAIADDGANIGNFVKCEVE